MSLIKTWLQSTTNLSPSLVPPHGVAQSTSNQAQSPPHSVELRATAAYRSFEEGSDRLSIIERNERVVQKQLQRLLDAQTEGLANRLGVQPDDADISDIGSSSGRLAIRRSKVMPVRQPRQQAVTLRATRRSIRDAMIDLSTIKDEELEAYDGEIKRCSAALEQIQDWEQRQQALNKAIEQIRTSESQQRINSLREDEIALQDQINAIEAQLSRLKDQQNAIRLELSRTNNAVDSRLSSYGESLKLVDRQVESFLRLPRPPSARGESSYLTLAPERRTLQMAQEHMTNEYLRFRDRRQASAEERESITEGLTVWQDVVHAVTHFERSLRRGIEALKSDELSSDTSRSSSRSQPVEYRGIDEVIQKMDDVILDLDSKFKLAEARGWKLLVCCIGAELDAFQQGRDLLRSTSSTMTQTSTPEEQSEYAPSEAQEVASHEPKGDHPRLDRSDATIRRPDATTARQSRLYHDDEPDLDLLVSKIDTDTEPD